MTDKFVNLSSAYGNRGVWLCFASHCNLYAGDGLELLDFARVCFELAKGKKV